jgi:3-oxoacyl-[acyl-carrier protein] reductase
MTLAGRVALVTGAARGIGSASALALADEGARVAVGYLTDEEQAEITASKCEGGMTVRIDVAGTDAVGEAFKEVEARLGPVEILVNNAGLTKDRLLMRMREEDWEQVINIDLNGVFRCTKRALPGMIQGGWGRVVTIGSVVGMAGHPGQTNYGAAKAGVIGFSKSLAREVASRGITVNVVAPGFVDTSITAKLSDAGRQALLDKVAMGRPGMPEEIAEAVRFCARASYMTGQVLAVDGGMA